MFPELSPNQAAFNVAFEGLKAQGFERSSNGGFCCYRGPEGRKCAVGHLIADEDYCSGFDDGPAPSGIVSRDDVFEAVNKQFPGVDRQLLVQMQSAHDNTIFSMEDSLRNVAKDYELEVPA